MAYNDEADYHAHDDLVLVDTGNPVNDGKTSPTLHFQIDTGILRYRQIGGDWASANRGLKYTTRTANATLAIADCGVVQAVTVDAVVLTLPATHAGDTFIVENCAADGAALVSISPQAADKFSGAGVTPADDKDLQNTKATAKKGDYVKLVADGVDGFVVQEMRGVWVRE